jgi:hypothetical protein
VRGRLVTAYEDAGSFVDGVDSGLAVAGLAGKVGELFK